MRATTPTRYLLLVVERGISRSSIVSPIVSRSFEAGNLKMGVRSVSSSKREGDGEMVGGILL